MNYDQFLHLEKQISVAYWLCVFTHMFTLVCVPAVQSSFCETVIGMSERKASKQYELKWEKREK